MRSSNVLIVLVVALAVMGFLSVFLMQGTIASTSSDISVYSSSNSMGGTSRPYMPYYNSQPRYHVFNFFNTGWLGLMLLLGILVTLGMAVTIANSTDSLVASVLYVIGSLLLFSSATIFLFGINDILTYTGHGETTIAPTFTQQYGWLIETIIYGLFGAAFIWGGDRVQKDEGQPLSHLALVPVASLMLLMALPVFIQGLHDALNPTSSSNGYTWALETIIFGIPGAFLFRKIDSLHKERGGQGSWLYLPSLGSGAILLFASIIAYAIFVLGIGNSYSNVGYLLPESIVFAAIGFAFFKLVDVLQSRSDSKAKTCIPLGLTPYGALLVFGGTLAFIFGLSLWINASTPTANQYSSSYSWLVQTFALALPGIALVYASDYLRRDDPSEESNLPYVAGVCGAILWLAGFLFLMASFNTTVLRPTDINWRQFVQALIFGSFAYLGINYMDAKRKLEEKLLPGTLALSGAVSLIAALGTLVFGLNSVLYQSSPLWDLLSNTACYAITGILMLWVANSARPLLLKAAQSVSKPRAPAASGLDLTPSMPSEPKKAKAAIRLSNCSKCKSMLRPSDKFCPNCGKKV